MYHMKKKVMLNTLKVFECIIKQYAWFTKHNFNQLFKRNVVQTIYGIN